MSIQTPIRDGGTGDSSPEQPPSPEVIMQLATGFMAAKHLFAASELGLFEALDGSSATLAALAARTGLTERAARISADAMVALGLLDRDGEQYRNTELSSLFLSGSGPADLRPFLRFWDKISYPAWAELADALAAGPSRELSHLDESLQEVAHAGIEAIVAGPAHALAATTDFSARRRLLDVGGGNGSWSIAVIDAHRHMRATVLELPAVAELARRRIAADGHEQRVAVVAADALADPIPAGHDVCLIANLIHYFSAQENQQLLERVRAAVEHGSMLLIADFWTNAAHTEPLIAALLAGEFAVQVRHGDVYSLEECRRWLAASGWQFIEHRPLGGPISLVLARAD